MGKPMLATFVGPGGSGPSATFLARALKCNEAELAHGCDALGCPCPRHPPISRFELEIAATFGVNKDSRGGLWINGREKREGDVVSPS